MSLINVPHPFSIVLKRFYCAQEVLSKIRKPIENNGKWVLWVYNRSEMVYLFGCTIVHHIHFCKHIWSHRLFHWNKYLHFYKDELHKAILLRTRHTYKHSSHTSLKKKKAIIISLTFLWTIGTFETISTFTLKTFLSIVRAIAAMLTWFTITRSHWNRKRNLRIYVFVYRILLYRLNQYSIKQGYHIRSWHILIYN